MSNIKLYLDYVNNFLTVEKFAEHYGLSLVDAEKIIRQGRKEHESKVSYAKLSKALKTNDFNSFQNVFSVMVKNAIKGAK